MHLLVIPVILIILYLLAIRGRSGHPGLEELRKWKYAHRGLHGVGKPENSMAAFRAALDAGYGIELDVHLLSDGNLAVIHDSALKRTTGAEGNVEDLTTEQLTQYRLEGTEETIPQFREVLDLFDGKAPLIVELKAFGGNHAALAKATCDMLESYRGPYCIESFDPRCILWLKQNRPGIIRGQLSENFFRTPSSMPAILKLLLSFHLVNFLTVPDFIAYRYQDLKLLPNVLCRKIWGVQGVTWTLTSQEQFDLAVQDGWIPIFENFEP